ncbi:CidA/LrgA family protein [Leadbettera azotonutricia]|uniref:Putative LrgA family protein n=1 Tax=Leadbettera azotonutricia (strain ATCC BAA-888 / DSM 13862 / ZAS-9) TaxID=545695 RepID=F5YDD7_LEAAZ|nr:CidA/LrgA family protein [Leadbettera azotonutricia]AEF80391.1 putative LrgA family protein [Leadbettera azotonutricia ZAS-9]
MEIFAQLAIILAFGFAGEILARALPLGMPASVLGMILMLIALGSKMLKPSQLGKTADFLGSHMAFFFLPVAIAIIENFSFIRPVVWQFFGICMVCTIVTFSLTYGTVRLCRVLLRGRV